MQTLNRYNTPFIAIKETEDVDYKQAENGMDHALPGR